MLDRPSAGVWSRSSNSSAGSSSKKAPTAPSWVSKVSTRPVSSRKAPRKVLAALTARALLVVALLVELAILRVGIDDLDEGYFAAQAARVLRGEVPYRDFDSLYT